MKKRFVRLPLKMQKFKKWMILCLSLVFTGQSWSSVAQQGGSQQSLLIAKLNQTIPQLLDSASIPGLAISVIRDGKMAYTQVYGVKSIETKEKMAINTVFEAASLSKPVFAYACLQLVDQGLLNLDKPLYTYLPYPDIERDARYKKITARMVLSHTSGFPNWRNNDSLRINFEPGQKFSYSGEGYVYLQKVVEKITGKPLNDFITEKVFRPLGMPNSSYVWRPDFDTKAATPHDGFSNPLPKNKPTAANAAASLHTTAPDYTAFITAVLNGTGLKKQTLAAMLTPQIQVPEERTNAAAALSKKVAWGLGIGLQEVSGDKAFWHWGDNYSFRCYVLAYPKEKMGVVYFTNSNNGLSVANRIVHLVTNREQPAIGFIDYQPYTNPGFLFRQNIPKQGVTAAIKPFLKSDHKPDIAEDEMNSIGYQLLRSGKVAEGKEVLQLNLEAYPQSANVYDSYAYACLLNGEKETAAQNYLKAYTLDPKNKEAKLVADQLTAAKVPKGNAEFKLKGYSNAKLVTLAGSFNNWNAYRNFFVKQGDEWVCRLDLTPGKYSYKIVIDGDWVLDPGNPEIAEENGYKNSVVVVK
ncbi:serine hydrolase [Adhaeribacter pallidiroseus]|uniref:Serine-type D-Ala-D-Ala carboxypeptidase n=1 Tax=Adhaeribacter pallidiroseus TaxID=2072847 RepID=A0A369QMN2_9BACT|nr:serine hydrolase [Adhaeribacter pallidiroseus]RDC65610.1 Serine-type D-Ala-D-Ala carboxypeptidase [Adhaeribacter pallidiroseus]